MGTTNPKLTPAMRRVLERMEKGMFIELETHRRYPYEKLWIDSAADYDINNPNGHLIDGRTVTPLIRRGFIFKHGGVFAWTYRITPKGRKALEE